MLKADLHLHSSASFDCSTSPETIVERCRSLGINCIAVADHGTIEGALRVREIAPFRVIVAQEVLTPLGEIMGMFLTQQVPSNIPVAEAIRHIKAQNGLVCLPHPFDYMRGINGRGRNHMDPFVEDLDVVEVFNARALRLGNPNGKALAFAAEHHLLQSAGSDAHTAGEIGHAYVEMPEFDDINGFRQSLDRGRVRGRYTCPLVHTAGVFRAIKKRIIRS